MTAHSFTKEFEEIQSLFATGLLNLWVISYGITHEAMVIAVFAENFMERKEITLGDCTYFSGALKGNPYHLTISSDFDEDGKAKFVILGNTLQLKIEFYRMTLPASWKKRFE